MAKNITLRLDVVADPGGKVKGMAVNMDDLNRAVKGVAESMRTSTAKLKDFSTMSATAIYTLQSMTTMVTDLSRAYATQIQAETQLATVMRERMDATEADIVAIKRLASAQQELGVIGDEVQLAGAQQVATFLENRASIETLLPAMNDLLAQQKGLNATSADAVSIANLMGKAMQGQTSALRRVGITFNEAQEAAMKNGTEQERAAMLAEIITQNVGHMNAELAATPVGQAKQLANALGDLKEKAGEYATMALPFMQLASTTVTVANGMGTMVAGVRAAVTWYTTLTVKAYDNVAALIAGRTAATGMTTGFNMASVAAKGAAVSVRVLGTALKSLLVTTFVGAALWALSEAVGAIISACSGADEAIDGAAEATRQAAEEAKRAKTEYEDWRKSLTDVSAVAGQYAAKELANLDKLYRAATDEAGARRERAAAAKSLIDQYPEYFGQMNTEQIMLGKAIGKYQTLKQAIYDAATARAISGKLEDNMRQIVEQQMIVDQVTEAAEPLRKNREEKRAVADKAQKHYDQTVRIGNFDKGAMDKATADNNLARSMAAMADAGYETAMKDARAAEQKIEDLKASNDKLYDLADKLPKRTFSASAPTRVQAAKPVEGKTRDKAVKEAKDKGNEVLQWVYEFAAKSAEAQRVLGKGELATYDELTGAIDFYTKIFQASAPKEAAVWAEKINQLKKYRKQYETLLGGVSDNPQSKPKAVRAQSAGERGMADFSKRGNADIFGQTWGDIKGAVTGVQSLTKALDENSTAWEKLQSVVEGMMQIYQSIAGIIQMVDMVQQVSTVNKVAGASAEASASGISAGAATVDANAQMADAAAKTMNAHAWMPFVGIALGAASVAAMLATLFSMPKFAKGGIAYGPTIGLFGEYSGASNNPEVVAPLDRLRSLIQGEGLSGQVTFRIKGRSLVGVTDRQRRHTSRI